MIFDSELKGWLIHIYIITIFLDEFEPHFDSVHGNRRIKKTKYMKTEAMYTHRKDPIEERMRTGLRTNTSKFLIVYQMDVFFFSGGFINCGLDGFQWGLVVGDSLTWRPPLFNNNT